MVTKVKCMVYGHLVFFFIYISLLIAGDTGKIAGTVMDRANGESLPGANIMI
ncbi:hypothetical protein JXO59_02140 [candidate division KSB1 bacterium]|nr:hypothetical protein [candidate division KSB1 bacterium]